MTRMEAAQICQSIKFILENSDYTEAVEEALDRAIEALEREGTLQNLTKPNKSDLISRKAAIDAVGKAMPQLTTPDGCGEFDHEIQIADEAFSDCMKIINDLPSAQPERKTDGDTISRQAAIEAVDNYDFDFPKYMVRFVTELRDAMKADIIHEIEALPSAQPFTTEQIQTMQELEAAQIEKAYELGKADRLTGHWIEDEKQNVLMRKFIEKGEVWRVCSVCGAGLMIGAEYETDKYYHETFHNYCPNCGADMRGGPTLTPEEFAEKMAGIAENGDEERKHVAADSIMCELLKSLGFGEGVGIFEDMDKWYS